MFPTGNYGALFMWFKERQIEVFKQLIEANESCSKLRTFWHNKVQIIQRKCISWHIKHARRTSLLPTPPSIFDVD